MNKNKIWTIVSVVVVLAVITGVVMWDRKVAKAPEVGAVPGSASTSAAEQVASTSGSSGLTVTFTTTTAQTQKSYTGPSFSLNYPGSWTAFSTPFFSVDNFGGKYQNGSMIPAGGAEIDVVTTTVYGSADEIMATELMSAVAVATSTITIDGVACMRADYQNSYAPGFPSQDVSLYCLRGSELWKIYFSYHVGDPAAQAHVADLNNVLSSLKFLP